MGRNPIFAIAVWTSAVALGAATVWAETSSWVGRGDGPAQPVEKPANPAKKPAQAKGGTVKVIKTVPKIGRAHV